MPRRLKTKHFTNQKKSATKDSTLAYARMDAVFPNEVTDEIITYDTSMGFITAKGVWPATMRPEFAEIEALKYAEDGNPLSKRPACKDGLAFFEDVK